jgi:DNA modification methylase
MDEHKTPLGRYINADCFDVMARMDAGSVDLVLADLPYGTTQNKWDSVLPFDQLWPELLRIAKPNAAFVFTAMQPFTSALVASQPKLFKYAWVWQKENVTGFLNAKKQPLRIHEDILVFYRKQATYNPQRRPGKPYTNVKRHYGSTNYGKVRPEHVTKCDGGRYPISILNFKRDKEKLHPTQKPVALCEYLVSTYTNPGDLVFDPTAGVASTCVAAENLGRRWIGCELSADYWAKGKERF